jgi:ribosomal protein L11 methylase PrmA
MADEYRRFWITSSLETERERLLAEAFEAGAEGAEETEGRGNYRACIYAPAATVEAIRERVSGLATPKTQIHDSEAIPDVDWSEAWKDGLEALKISSRLIVRPPFIDVELEPDQQEVVIDPGQAFGTGGHASTRLCLEWIDRLYAEAADRARFDRVLDAGTGSGVLAFAALKLGAKSAVGFDLDEVAIDAARASARENGPGGPSDRLRPRRASRNRRTTGAGGAPRRRWSGGLRTVRQRRARRSGQAPHDR